MNITRNTPPAHPDNSYIAHAVYDLPSGSSWGSLIDGPATWRELVDTIAAHFDARPDATRLRVWYMQANRAPMEVTYDLIDAMNWPEAEWDADEYGDWKYEQPRDLRMDMEDAR